MVYCACFFLFFFEDGIWDLIVLIPDCLSFYFGRCYITFNGLGEISGLEIVFI